MKMHKIVLGTALLLFSIPLAVIVMQQPQEIRQRAQVGPTPTTPPQCQASNGLCVATADGCFAEETDSGKLDCGTGETCCSLIVPPQCEARTGVCVLNNVSCFDYETDIGPLDCQTGRRCCADKLAQTPSPSTGSGSSPTAKPTTPATTVPTVKPTTRPTATPIPTPTTGPTPTARPTTAAAIPTSQVAQGETSVTFTVLLHGIGNSGDNMTTNNSLSNKTPQNPTREFTVHIDNAPGQYTKNEAVSFFYDQSVGAFTGRINLGSVSTGSYNIRVKTYNSVEIMLPSQAITANQQNAISRITLTIGDTNGDNTINALDYNSIMSCYYVLAPTNTCSDSQKLQADLNDDGKVDGFDYNLFLREIARN